MADIWMGITVIVVSLVAIAVQAKLMSRQAFAGFLLALLLVISGGNLVISLNNSGRFSQELASICAGQQEVARTSAEAFAEQNEESITFLAKSATFPGFTHQELNERIQSKQIKGSGRVKRLETVADNTCKGH